MLADRSAILRVSLITLLGLFIAWQIVQRGVAAYLAREQPQAALWLRADEPSALVAVADAKLNRRQAASGGSGQAEADRAATEISGDRLGGWSEIALRALAHQLDEGEAASGVASPPLDDAERAQIRLLAERALRSDPLNARALRILGQVAEGAGEPEEAIKLMGAAARLSLSETAAVYAMMRASFEAKDYQRTLYFADALMRKRPQLVPQAAAVLAQMAESIKPETFAVVEEALHDNPPWRRAFFASLNQSITDARTPLKLLLGLKDTAAEPDTSELKQYLDFLISKRFYELAYYTWLQFLPQSNLARVGLINNGAFADAPSGLPFDWTLSGGPGVTIDIAPRPDLAADRALFMELGPGRVSFRGVWQVLMLTPGTYRFSGRYRGEISGPRGVQWHVTCLGSSTALADGPMFVGLAAAWTTFEFSFDVPEGDCRAQELRVDLAARSPSEQLVAGSVWYDDLRIEPVEAKTDAEAAASAGAAPAAP